MLRRLASPTSTAHLAHHLCQTWRGQASKATDKIILEGLVFHGYHGVLKEERTLGQKFLVDATLTTDTSRAGKSDNLNDTINYAEVYRRIKTIVEGPPLLLIETVAEQIASAILCEQPKVEKVSVHIRKPHVAVEGLVGSLGVEITRQR